MSIIPEQNPPQQQYYQQKELTVMLNFYDEIQLIKLPNSFFAFCNLIPSVISKEYSHLISNFVYSYSHQNTIFEILDENSYEMFCNLAQMGKVNHIKIELKDNMNANKNQFVQNKMEFDVGCKNCSQYPLYGTVYKCARCKFYICQKCEETFGEDHQHALIQIRNQENVNDSSYIAYTNSIMFTQKQGIQAEMSKIQTEFKMSNINMNSNVFKSSVKQISNKLKVIPEKIYGFISGISNENQNPKTLVKQMRNEYALMNYTDIQIENALKECDFDKDKALLKLLN